MNRAPDIFIINLCVTNKPTSAAKERPQYFEFNKDRTYICIFIWHTSITFRKSTFLPPSAHNADALVIQTVLCWRSEEWELVDSQTPPITLLFFTHHSSRKPPWGSKGLGSVVITHGVYYWPWDIYKLLHSKDQLNITECDQFYILS